MLPWCHTWDPPKDFKRWHPNTISQATELFGGACVARSLRTAPRCRCDVSIAIYSPSGLLLVEFSGNRPRPLDAFHGSRSVPRPPRRCVFSLSRATGGPVALLSEPRASLDATNWQCLCRWNDALLPVAFGLANSRWQGGRCAQSDNGARLPDRAPHRRTAHPPTHPHAHTRMRARSPAARPWHASRVEMLVSCPR